MKLNKEQILEILPHRAPMLLVDSVEEIVPGDRISSRFLVPTDLDIFRGHFPGDPILPGVYSVECMAQTADILLLSNPRYAGKLPLFIGINGVRFRSKVKPGDTVFVHAHITAERTEKAIITCHAELYCQDALAAEGDVTLAMR